MRYAAVIVVIAAIADLTVWSGVYTDAQAKRGGALYAERCASCHAPDLSGMDQAPALAGADFMTEWNDLSLNDLVERVRISMPADKPGSLDRQQVADAIALILQKNSFPAGQSELAADADALKGIKFLAKKPEWEYPGITCAHDYGKARQTPRRAADALGPPQEGAEVRGDPRVDRPRRAH